MPNHFVYLDNPILFSLPIILHFLLCTGTFPCSRPHYHWYKWGIICWFLLCVSSKVRCYYWRVLLSSEFRMVGSYLFYKVCFKTSVKVKKLTDFINLSSWTLSTALRHSYVFIFITKVLSFFNAWSEQKLKTLTGVEENLFSSSSFGQAGLAFFLPRFTSCLS